MENKGLCAYVTEEPTKGNYISRIVHRKFLEKYTSLPFKIEEICYDYDESILVLGLESPSGRGLPYALTNEITIRHFCSDMGIFRIFNDDFPVLNSKALKGKSVEVFLEGSDIKGICPIFPVLESAKNKNLDADDEKLEEELGFN